MNFHTPVASTPENCQVGEMPAVYSESPSGRPAARVSPDHDAGAANRDSQQATHCQAPGGKPGPQSEGLAKLRQAFPLTWDQKLGRAWGKLDSAQRGLLIAVAFHDAPPGRFLPEHWHSWEFMQQYQRDALQFHLFQLWRLLDGLLQDTMIDEFRTGQAERDRDLFFASINCRPHTPPPLGGGYRDRKPEPIRATTESAPGETR